MSDEKIIRTFDGTIYEEIHCKEILKNGEPTGHYKKLYSEQKTEYGTHLDSDASREQLRKDIEELRYVGTVAIRNAMITDYKNFYSFMLYSVRSGANKNEVNSWYDWVIDILTSIGYVNDEYKFDKKNKTIKFIVSPKDDGAKIELTLITLDNDCYKLNGIG